MAVSTYPSVSKERTSKNGFPHNIFIQKVDDKYLCSYCRYVLREPMQSFCGHRFCKRCVEDFVSPTQCPICVKEELEEESSMLSIETLFPDNAIRRDLNRLDVKCPNKHCDWKGKYREYIEHETKCQYVSIACPQGCGETIMLKDHDFHMASLCSMRKDRCKECGADVAIAELKSHLEVCPKVKMKCSGCGTSIPRDQMSAHQDPVKGSCSRQYAPCMYGCKDMIKSYDVQSHNKKCVVQHVESFLERLRAAEESGAFTEGGASASATIACAPAESKVVSRRIEEITETVRQLHARVQNIIDKEYKVRYPSKRDDVVSENNVAQSQGLMRALSELLVSDPWYQAMETKIFSVDAIMSAMHQDLERVDRVVAAHEDQRRKERDDLAKMQSTISKLQRELALKDIALAEQNVRLQALDLFSHDGVLVWKITDFSKKRAEAVAGRPLSLYSQCFYTSRYGYRMCCRLYPNGDASGKGTHVSLFFVIMRGDFDALLPWPFKQKVTLMILDQDNSNHIIDAFQPDEASSSFKRPTSEMNIASGCPMFSAFDRLIQNKHNYLRDDTLFVKCIVDTSNL